MARLFYMKGRDVDVVPLSPPTWVTWNANDAPDPTGAQYLGPKAGASPLGSVRCIGHTPGPTINSLSPASMLSPSPVQGVDTGITLVGDGFNSDTLVLLNDVLVPTTFIDVHHVSVIVPAVTTQLPQFITVQAVNAAGSPGQGGLSLEIPNFEIDYPVPTWTNATVHVPLGETGDTFFGIYSTVFPATEFVFNGTHFPCVFHDDQVHPLARITSRSGDFDAYTVSAGTVSVALYNPGPAGGLSVLSASIVIDNPSISSLSLASTYTGNPVSTLTVTGVGFNVNAVINVDGSPVATTRVSSTSLTCAYPSTAAVHTYVITVTSGGATTNSKNLTIAKPTFISIVPTNYATGGSGSLVVNGSAIGIAFYNGIVININGVAQSTHFVSGTSINCTPDKSVAGTFTVTLTGGTVVSDTSMTFTVTDPTLTSVAPANFARGNPTNTLSALGANYIGTAVININGVPQTTTIINTGQLNCTIDDVTASGTFTVTVTSGGVTTGSKTYTVTDPTLSSIAPATIATGDTAKTVTCTGTNFINGAVVNFDGSPVTTTFVSSTSLTFVVSSGTISSAGVHTVTVTSGGVTTVSKNLTVADPTLTSIAPATVATGDTGKTLTCTGANYLSSAVINVDGSPVTTHFASSTSLTYTVPDSFFATAGAHTVTVTSGGVTTASKPWTVADPTLTSIAAVALKVGDTGKTLTCTGANYLSSAVINVDGSPVTTTFVSSTSLTYAIPDASLTTVGTHTVTVTSGGVTTGSKTYTVGPLMTSISVTTGIQFNPAQAETITGTQFTATSQVQINGVGITTTFVSSTSLTCSFPAAGLANSPFDENAVYTITVADTGGTVAGQSKTFTVSAMSGQTYRFKGDVGLTVSQWSDQSGNSNHRTQGTAGNQGTIVTDLNSHSGLRFTAANSTWYVYASSIPQGTYSHAWVFKLASTPGSGTRTTSHRDKDTTNNTFDVREFANQSGFDAHCMMGKESAASKGVGHVTALDTSAHYAIETYNNAGNTATTSYTMKLDSGGTNKTLSADTTNFEYTSTNKSTVGADVTSGNAVSQAFDGTIYEDIRFNRVLTAGEQTNIGAYFHNKYGI